MDHRYNQIQCKTSEFNNQATVMGKTIKRDTSKFTFNINIHDDLSRHVLNFSRRIFAFSFA